VGDQNGFSRTLHGGERRDYDDRSIETSAKGGVRLGSAGRRATHSPPPSQISKVAAASTIPVTTEVHRDLIIALAARFNLPSMHAFRTQPMAGALASYGISVVVGITSTKVNWILDADIRSFFDTVPSQNFIHLRNLGDFRPKGAGNHQVFLGGS
jgi:hypothetical protein